MLIHAKLTAARTGAGFFREKDRVHTLKAEKKSAGAAKKVWGYIATILAANTGVYGIGFGHPWLGSFGIVASFCVNYYTEFGMPAWYRFGSLSHEESLDVDEILDVEEIATKGI